jgi:hypothetical protein
MSATACRTAVVAAAALALVPAPAGAVHESHHGSFVGRTSQGERLVMNTTSHTRLGIRFRWRASCELGSVLRISRFRNVRVDENGRFFRRGTSFGVGVRGKIGLDPQGNPVFPAPFSFANNEARGRLRVSFESVERGECGTGLVRWEARR